jgi:predicted enzyme related to lactoylglutathione lyase
MKTKKNPVVHFEMPYHDSGRVSKFYSQAFGWDMNDLGAQMGSYVIAHTTETDANNMVLTPGNINGGFFSAADAPGVNVSVVIAVDDLEGAMQRVKDGGGEVQGEPIDIPGIGRYVSIRDTEGNRVGVLQPVVRG